MARWVEKREKERRDELLSAYLDGQLGADERARLETQLATDPALRAELETLRRTVSLVRDLPRVSAPRNFILPQAVAARSRSIPLRSRRSLAPLLTAATSLAALLFIAVLLGDLIVGTGRQALAPAAPLHVEEQEAVTVTVLAEQDWGASPTAPALALAGPTEEAQSAGEEQQGVMAAPLAVPSPVPASPAAEEGGLVPAVPGPTEMERAAGIPSQTPVPEAEAPKYAYVTASPTPMAEAVPPVVVPEEAAPAEAERTPVNIRGGPLPLSISRVLEIGLGLIVLILACVTVWAWRSRR